MQNTLFNQIITLLLNQAVENAQKGNLAQAEKGFRRVLKLDSMNETALLWLAWVVENQTESRDLLNRAIKTNPLNRTAWNYLVQTRSILRDYDAKQRQIIGTSENNYSVAA